MKYNSKKYTIFLFQSSKHELNPHSKKGEFTKISLQYQNCIIDKTIIDLRNLFESI